MSSHEELSSAGRIHQLTAAGLIAKWMDDANEAARKPRAVSTDEGQAWTKDPAEVQKPSTGSNASAVKPSLAAGVGDADVLNLDSTVRAFNLMDFHGIFMIWAFGLSISLIVFGVEVISRRIPWRGCNG